VKLWAQVVLPGFPDLPTSCGNCSFRSLHASSAMKVFTVELLDLSLVCVAQVLIGIPSSEMSPNASQQVLDS